MEQSMACNKSSYVSVIKIKGKPIIPPLMTPEREAEMRHYKQLAMAVEARLKTWNIKECSNIKNNKDGEMTLPTSSECVSKDHSFAGLVCGNKNSDEILFDLMLEDGPSTINNAGSKKFKLREVDQLNLRCMTNTNLPIGMGCILKNCQCIEVSQQGETHSNYDVEKDSNKNVMNANTELQCSCLRNKDIKFLYKLHQEVMRDDTKASDKLEFRSDNFDLTPTEYKPWEKIQGDCKEATNKLNRTSNQLKPVDTQVVTGSDLNKNVVQSTQQRFDKDDIHCLPDNLIVTATGNIVLNSQMFPPVDQRHNYTPDNQVSEPSSYQTVIHQGESHSEILYEHDASEGSGTFAHYSHKAEKPQEISEKSMEGLRTPLKICEGIVDISKSYLSEIIGNVKFNNLESNNNTASDKNNYSTYSSPVNTDFSVLGDVNSSTPHVLTQDNLEDSVSSIAMTSSTDLNQYMNTTGSSGTASPGHNTPSVGQDVMHNSINATVPLKSVQESNTKQDLKSFNCNDPFILRAEEQINSPNFDNIPRTDSNKGNTEKIFEHNTSFGLEEKCHDNSGNITEGNIKMSRNISYNNRKCLCTPKTKFRHSNANIEGDTALVNECNCMSPKNKSGVRDIDYELEEAPPRLVRQNSYTLETPSPLLIAHMETQKGKSFVADMTKNACVSPKTCRKAWDLTQAKTNWELVNKRMISYNEKPKSSKKSLSIRQSSFTGQLQNHNSSLPTSKTSSPIKLQTPYASVDCLPSAVLKESSKTSHQPSTQRKYSKVSIYSPKSKESNRYRSCSASPFKTNKNPSVDKKKNLSPLKCNTGEITADVGAHMPLTSQRDLHGLIINMQSQHSQQMAVLLARQRKEQEEMRKTFLQQQNELLEEIKKINSTVCPPAEIQKRLNQSVDHLNNNNSKSLSSSTNDLSSVLCTTNLSLSDSDTLHINRHTPCESTLSDTTLMIHLDSSASLGNKHNTTKSSQKSHEIITSIDTTGRKKKLVSELAEIVRKELLQESITCKSSKCGNKQKCNSEYSLRGTGSVGLQSDLLHDVSKVKELSTQELQDPSPLKLQSPIANLPVELVRCGKQNMNETQSNNRLHPVANSSPSSGQDKVVVREKESGTFKRELFPNSHKDDSHHLSQVSCSELEKAAATKITAAAKGFLTRRLFRTVRVQDLILTIRDTLLCAMQLNQECWPDITVEDVALHRRLIQQVTAACYALHEVFFSLSTTEQMAIISADRDRLRNRTPRPPLPRPLSAATKRAIERKAIQYKSMCLPNRPVSADCNLQRFKTTIMDKDAFYSDFDVVPTYSTKRHQQQQGPRKNRRSLSITSERRPWR